MGLHEIAKLLAYAGVDKVGDDFWGFVRLGTCGGVGVPPGEIILTDSCVDAELVPGFSIVQLGKVVRYPAVASDKLNARISAVIDQAKALGKTVCSLPPLHRGITMTADCFYESQGRLDGVFQVWYDEEDKLKWLKEEASTKAGVVNIEMECAAFLAFCGRLGVPGTMINVAILNRLEGDQVSPHIVGSAKEFSERPVEAADLVLTALLG